MDTLKVKTPAKLVVPSGRHLDSAISRTVSTIASVVGSTLGPGGRPVLIERQEYNMPPIITKDGVSVMRGLGFQDPLDHCIFETFRDVATRTVDAAGDGTTTATVLGEAILRRTRAYCEANPTVSPQSVVQDLRRLAEAAEAAIRVLATPTFLGTPKGDDLLHAVAKVSANGDVELADAVMAAFAICGDAGTVTITEESGNPSRYETSKIEGFRLDIGYEDGLGRPASTFINRVDTQQIRIEKPLFILYFGAIIDIQTIAPILEELQARWIAKSLTTPNVVVVATRWGERVIEGLAHNWVQGESINVLPVTVPLTALQNSQAQALDDLAAVVSTAIGEPATVFNPNTRPLSGATMEDFGNLTIDPSGVCSASKTDALEMGRYGTVIYGFPSPDTIAARVEQVEAQLSQAGSRLDALWIRNRIALLTQGIAVLKVIGGSNAELKERRDRADDAVCAVKAAIKRPSIDADPWGCLPGAGWGLLAAACHLVPKLQISIDSGTPPADAHRGVWIRSGVGPNRSFAPSDILASALVEPAVRILANAGELLDGIVAKVNRMLENTDIANPAVYNSATHQWIHALDCGLVDSTPAVIEALRNAVSASGVLATLGGAVVNPRDYDVEKAEARDAAEFDRMIKTNPADERQ
jgi:chaperonin GroEL